MLCKTLFITIEDDDLKLLVNKYCMCAPWESKTHQWAYDSRAEGTESKETQSTEVNSGLAVLQQLEWVFYPCRILPEICTPIQVRYVRVFVPLSSAGVLSPPDGYFL